MKFFKSATTSEEPKPAAVPKVPVVEGWSERELVSVYNAAPLRNLKRREQVFPEAEFTESFFLLLDGEIQVVVKADGHPGRPGFIRRGDCIAPLPKSPGLTYCAEASEPCSLIEITPAVLKHLPEKTQLSIYKVAVQSTSRINAYIRSVNGEINAKNAMLASYVSRQNAARFARIQSPLVQSFIRDMPRMPTYAMDLAVKLLDERTSVQDVVEGIKRDPSVAGIVLRSVNSGLYSLPKKIETLYHACMILGFTNIYNLILREAIQSAMPITEETQQNHRHSCLMAVLCYEVASAAKDVHQQMATTMGLLHDLGKGVQILMKRAHPAKAEFVESLPSDKLGADLLQVWGLPERICAIVENQQQPEFTPPDLVAAEYRRELGALHVAHVLESMLLGESLQRDAMIYTREYMVMLGLPTASPAEFMKDRLIPSLIRNRRKFPEQVQAIIPKEIQQ